MVCQTCGANLEATPVAEARFCSKCGAPIATAAAQPPPPAQPPRYPVAYPPSPVAANRVGRNLQVLGILWCAYGAYRILAAFFGIFFLRAMAIHGMGGPGWQFPGHMPPFGHGMAFLVPVIATVTAISASLAFLTGFSLLTRRDWGRTLSIVAAVLALFKFPIGTALGIYSLWVMAPAASGLEYEAISAQPYST